MSADPREWLRVDHTAQNITSVTVTLLEDNRTVKWATKCYESTVKDGIATARHEAEKRMVILREAAVR